MKPVKPAEPVRVEPRQIRVRLPRVAGVGIATRKDLTNVAPIPLVPITGVLFDAEGLFYRGGIRKYDVAVAPVLRQRDSGLWGRGLATPQKDAKADHANKADRRRHHA